MRPECVPILFTTWWKSPMTLCHVNLNDHATSKHLKLIL